MVNFNQCRLYGISNKKYLAELLKIDKYMLRNVEKYFTTIPFQMHFKNGKVRTLYNPPKEYKQVLKRINYYLQQIDLPNYIFGGIKRRDYISNAAVHKMSEFYLLLDLKDFFPSTRDLYIYQFFKNKLHMSEDIAKIMTDLVTEPCSQDQKMRHLPQGYPTSPLLSYFSYFDLYNGIFEVAQKNSITFSCYYDDFTFSSENRIKPSFKCQIINLILSYNLNVNKKKTKLLKNTKGIRITGTILKKHVLKVPNKLQLKMYNNFLKLLNLHKNNSDCKDELLHLCHSIQGCMSAIKSIETEKNFQTISNKINEIKRELTK